MKKSQELYISLFLTIISVSLTVQSYAYDAESAMFPRFLSILMTIFSLMLIFKALRQNVANTVALPSTNFWLAGIILIASIAYTIGIQYLGYFVSTTLFLVLSMFGFGERRPMPIIIASVAFLGVIYALFISFLGIRLPQGLFF